MKLSVLMSVYRKESPDFFRQSLDSLAAQTLPANEFLIVEDGPLGKELQAVIADYKSRLPIVSLSLPVNVGLGAALREGLNVCGGEFVARMDSDDICVLERFRMQMDFLERNPLVDVLGGAWVEFDEDPSRPHSMRSLPAEGPELLRYARFRNPINHPAIIFRRASVLAAGSYRSYLDFEDYHLFARMLMLGYRLYNMKEILLYHRVGNGMMSRRGGYAYFKRDIAFQLYLYRIGFLGALGCLRNILLRAPVRLTPTYLRALCYGLLLRTRFTPKPASCGENQVVKGHDLGSAVSHSN
jgi:glycosyltransferase involved in cell wall biosynthesis